MRTSDVRVLGSLRLRENFERYGHIVKEGFFSTAETKQVFKWIGYYLRKYDDKASVPLSFLKISAEEVKDDDRQLDLLKVIDLMKFKPRTEKYVEDLVRRFGQRALMKQAIIETFDKLQNEEDILDLTKLRERVEQAMEIVSPKISVTDYFEDAVDNLVALDTEPRVPTGIEEIDHHTRGGLPYGRLGLIIAPPKKGKTTFLVNVGAYALKLGYKVLHLSLEINKRETSSRYSMCLANKDFNYLASHQTKLRAFINRIKKRGGSLIIEDLSDHAPTIEEIDNIVTQHRTKFDLLIVDYPDLCVPKMNRSEERPGIKEVYTMLRRVGTKRDISIWGASQSNRGSLDKKIVGPADVAEDIRKIAILDLGVFWCQTPEEKEDGLVRLYVGATRFANSNPIFMAGCDFDRMRIFQVNRRKSDVQRTNDDDKERKRT